MPNTIRDRSALLALLADNSTGEISAQDLRDVLVSVHGVYGELRVLNGSTISVGTGKVRFPSWNVVGLSAGTTPDISNNNITVATSGIYKATFDLSFRSSAGIEYEFEMRINDVASTPLTHVGGTGGIVRAGFASFVSMSASDYADLYVSALSGSGDVNPLSGHLLLERVQ